MMHFPGWARPAASPRERRMGGIPFPLNPLSPPLPSLPIHPGTPGGFGGAPGNAGANTPLSGMAAYGVPVGYSRNGTPVLMAGQGQGQGQEFQLPPDLPGMPKMPGPPSGLFSGGDGGGLFRSAAPVAPFNSANQVQQLQAMDPRNQQR